MMRGEWCTASTCAHRRPSQVRRAGQRRPGQGSGGQGRRGGGVCVGGGAPVLTWRAHSHALARLAGWTLTSCAGGAFADYRTAVSGILPKHLQRALPFKQVHTGVRCGVVWRCAFTRLLCTRVVTAQVQREVADMLKGRVLVGHAVHNDLKVRPRACAVPVLVEGQVSSRRGCEGGSVPIVCRRSRAQPPHNRTPPPLPMGHRCHTGADAGPPAHHDPRYSLFPCLLPCTAASSACTGVAGRACVHDGPPAWRKRVTCCVVCHCLSLSRARRVDACAPVAFATWPRSGWASRSRPANTRRCVCVWV